MIHSGTINNAKGTFGFIFCEALDRKVFYHISEFKSAQVPRDGMAVKFELAPARNSNQPEVAVNVRPLKPSVENGKSLLAGGN